MENAGAGSSRAECFGSDHEYSMVRISGSKWNLIHHLGLPSDTAAGAGAAAANGGKDGGRNLGIGL